MQEAPLHGSITPQVKPTVIGSGHPRFAGGRGQAIAKVLVGGTGAVELAVGRGQPLLANCDGKLCPRAVLTAREGDFDPAADWVNGRLPEVRPVVDVVPPELKEVLRAFLRLRRLSKLSK